MGYWIYARSLILFSLSRKLRIDEFSSYSEFWWQLYVQFVHGKPLKIKFRIGILNLLLTFPKEPFPRFLENLYWPILISLIDIFVVRLLFKLLFNIKYREDVINKIKIFGEDNSNKKFYFFVAWIWNKTDSIRFLYHIEWNFTVW